ncbi:MAG: DUF4209 domain-containing protein, partial [Oscillospiraceae bacterium]|nr:DUF4209 domain-containing protein [Oscillospiraceae bacterium]
PNFSPMWELSDGTRSFAVDDMTDEDYVILSSLDLVSLPVALAVRVADLLWFKCKNRDAAQFSIDNYYKLYLSSFDYDNWLDCVDYIKRAVTFTQKLNDSTNRDKYIKDLFDKLIVGNGNDKRYFSITVAEFLIEQNCVDLKPIIPIMDNIIAQSDVRKSERAFEIKKKIYKNLKDNEMLKNTNSEHAEYLVSISNTIQNDNFLDLSQAEQCLTKAIKFYRNGDNKEAADDAHRKLLDVQKRKEQIMPWATQKFDVTDFYNHTKDCFEGLSFEEHIIRMADFLLFFSKEELRNSVYDERFLSRRFFSNNIVDQNGRTICEIPALDDNSNAENEKMQMYFELWRRASIYGDTLFRWAIELLNERFEYTEDNLNFIVKDNWIIPKGRNRILQMAVYWGLKGDLYLALHIIAPQVENLFRSIAIELGSNMSNIDAQGIASDKILSSIFDDEILNECYDENILFTFRSLMNEKAGGNYRNKIAHGIMEENECKNGAVRYLLCATIKVLLLTSPAVDEIAKSQTKKDIKTGEQA